MRGVLDKRGQMKLSFGMIFSIILIIAFLAFTIYAITKFLGVSKSVQIGNFAESVQNDVNRIWKGGQGSTENKYTLPSDIQEVCFADFYSQPKGPKNEIYDELKQVFFEFENMVFYPVGSGEGLDATDIENINITKITSEENPYCIENAKGDIKMNMKMSHQDSLVTITRG